MMLDKIFVNMSLNSRVISYPVQYVATDNTTIDNSKLGI